MEALLRRLVLGLSNGRDWSMNGRVSCALMSVPRYRFTSAHTDRFDNEDAVFLLDDGTARE